MLSPVVFTGQDFFPIQDVRAGLRGIGKTVFQGDRVDDFQVEILGVLQNFGPGQPIIIARLSGGPLAETGILQGMSGSPVYIDGKLLGAVALGFPFSKEPIAGIQPIQSMIDNATFGVGSGTATAGTQSKPIFLPANTRAFLSDFNYLPQLLSPATPRLDPAFGEVSEITTPMALNGFTPGAFTHLDAPLGHLGLTAKEGVITSTQSSQAGPVISGGARQKLKPGSMISVGLITGDLNMTADGTVTYIDGNRVYAFGHRFLNSGRTEMPFAYSDVIACIPNVNSSFKLSEPREWIGTIVSDHATAVAGELGRSAHTVPVQIAVNTGTSQGHTYHLQLVNDRFLTPFLTQAALFSTLDATERSIGAGTLKLQGEVEFEGNFPPLIVHDVYVTDSGLLQQASADAVVTLSFVLGGGFADLHVKDMKFRLVQVDGKRQLRLAHAWTSAHEVHPGQKVEVTAVLEGENGVEQVKTIPYEVPVGAPEGLLNLTISDANTLNFPDFAGIAQSQFRSAGELIEAVNRYRGSESLFVRVWRQQPAFTVGGPMPGGELTDPPPSVVLVLADPSASTSSAATSNLRGSDVAEITVPVPGFSVTGSKTVQIEIKD